MSEAIPAARRPPLPMVQAWLLGGTVAAALLWRWLPPLPPAALAALPALLVLPNAPRSVGGARLAAAMLLLFLVLHGRGSPGDSPSPAAQPDGRALAASARALLLQPVPQPALGLAALLEPEESGPGEEPERQALVCAGWQLDSLTWRPLPGTIELWPHARRCPPLPRSGFLLLAPGAAPDSPALPRTLWEPFRAPLGPFAGDPAGRAWQRGRVGRLSLDSARVRLRPLAAPREGRLAQARHAWRRSLERLRVACARRLAQGTGEGGPWLVAVLLGDQGVLPPEDVAIWQRTGLAHLLAVSGLNVGVLALALRAGLAPLPLRGSRKDLLLAGLLLLYIPLAGDQVSVRRAVVMALLLLAARRLERPAGGLSVLALAAVWILWRDPAQLAHPGFLMSFGAVATLVLGLAPGHAPAGARPAAAGIPAPPLRRAARLMGKALRGIGTALWVTVLAQAGTVLPQLACFGVLPLSGLVLNLAAVPVSSLLTVAGFLHLLLPLPGEPLGAFCRVLANFLVALARRAPVCSLAWSPHPVQLGLIALALALLFLRDLRLRLRVLASLALALLGADLLPRLLPTGSFACMFDVGQGDAILLHGPRVGGVLVDAGWSNPIKPDTRGAQLAEAVERLQPGGLDWLVLTHPDQDHLGGAEGLLASLPVRRVLWNGEWKDNSPQDRLRRRLAALGVPLVEARPGALLQASCDWRLRVLGPPPHGACPPGNERSVVLRVEGQAGSLLLTGDAGLEEERRLAPWRAWLQADWLKAGHHGSRHSTGAGLLAWVQPRQAWISSGRGNSYGHPHPELLERLARHRVQVFRSDRQGWRWQSLDGRAGPRRAWTRPVWRWQAAANPWRAPPVARPF